MTLCVIDHGHCCCMPDDGIPCQALYGIEYFDPTVGEWLVYPQ